MKNQHITVEEVMNILEIPVEDHQDFVEYMEQHKEVA